MNLTVNTHIQTYIHMLCYRHKASEALKNLHYHITTTGIYTDSFTFIYLLPYYHV